MAKKSPFIKGGPAPTCHSPASTCVACTLFIGNGGQVPTPRSQGSYMAGIHGNLPAIATHAGIEAASCTWRWQAGGGQV